MMFRAGAGLVSFSSHFSAMRLLSADVQCSLIDMPVFGRQNNGWYFGSSESSMEALPADIKVIQDQLMQALLAVDQVTFKRAVSRYLPGAQPHKVMENLVAPVLERIGKGWESGEYSLSQVYMSGRICEEVLDSILEPAVSQGHDQPPMAIVVLEDHHFLGKRIVYSALRAGGFALADYGQMKVAPLAERVIEERIEILLISVLMLPSALRVKNLRTALNHAGASVKIVVGGAPFRFDRNLSREVRADEYGCNASEAIEIVNRIIGDMR
jgi:methanogenic corrinoid protein MtbC1